MKSYVFSEWQAKRGHTILLFRKLSCRSPNGKSQSVFYPLNTILVVKQGNPTAEVRQGSFLETTQMNNRAGRFQYKIQVLHTSYFDVCLNKVDRSNCIILYFNDGCGVQMVVSQPSDLITSSANPARLGHLFSYSCCSLLEVYQLHTINCGDNEIEPKSY